MKNENIRKDDYIENIKALFAEEDGRMCYIDRLIARVGKEEDENENI